MTNTENTSAADKRADKKASAVSEPTTVTTAPPTTTVVERRGVSGGVLIGAIGAALAVGLLLGGGTGALITHIYESGNGQGQIRIGQLGGMPGQQQGGGQPGGPQGGFPGGPPQGPGQQQDDDSSTDQPDTGVVPDTDSDTQN
jgi:hypothetical protein